MRKKIKYFVEDVIPYRKELLICTGLKSTEEILKTGKELKLSNGFKEFIKGKKEFIDKSIKENCAFMMVDHRCAGIIRLRDYEDSWEFWETLIHELNHYVHFLCENIGAESELELQAYLQEYLFRSIRRKLQGVDKIK